MNARQRVLATLMTGAVVLLVSVLLVLFAGLNAWNLQQQIYASNNNKNITRTEIATTQNYLVQASSHGAAGAVLLARLRTTARQTGVSLARAEPRPENSADPKIVKISAQASGTSREIAEFLYAIESKPPALMIERARLTSENDNNVSVDILVLARAQFTEDNQ